MNSKPDWSFAILWTPNPDKLNPETFLVDGRGCISIYGEKIKNVEIKETGELEVGVMSYSGQSGVELTRVFPKYKKVNGGRFDLMYHLKNRQYKKEFLLDTNRPHFLGKDMFSLPMHLLL